MHFPSEANQTFNVGLDRVWMMVLLISVLIGCFPVVGVMICVFSEGK